jgi:hypothetical protein
VKMKLLNESGALSGYLIAALLLMGVALLYGSLSWFESFYLRLLGWSIGLAMVGSAGFAGRASALGLRAFGEEPWRKARSSYDDSFKSDGK